jgi:hypothetical protein
MGNSVVIPVLVYKDCILFSTTVGGNVFGYYGCLGVSKTRKGCRELQRNERLQKVSAKLD